MCVLFEREGESFLCIGRESVCVLCLSLKIDFCLLRNQIFFEFDERETEKLFLDSIRFVIVCDICTPSITCVMTLYVRHSVLLG